MARILIIEDDPLIARMYQSVFRFDGYQVDMARNGEEGIELMKKNKPTMVLLDIMMPKMTGLEVLRDMKINPETKKIPVVVLTNLSAMEDAETAIELGAIKYIVKSGNKPRQIVKQINEIIKAYTRDDIPSV